MLPHEQKMSVINLVLKRFKNTRDQQAIPSKERLIFHCGYRRYAASPIFSQHTAANKHKVRFLVYTLLFFFTFFFSIVREVLSTGIGSSGNSLCSNYVSACVCPSISRKEGWKPNYDRDWISFIC